MMQRTRPGRMGNRDDHYPGEARQNGHGRTDAGHITQNDRTEDDRR